MRIQKRVTWYGAVLGLGASTAVLAACATGSSDSGGGVSADPGSTRDAAVADGAAVTARDDADRGGTNVMLPGADAATSSATLDDASPAPIDAGRDAAPPTTDSGHDAAVTPDSSARPDAGVDSGVPVVAVVYGHSATVLYGVDPTSHVVTKVGDFRGCGDEVIDLAVDKGSKMYATSSTGFFAVNASTAECTRIAAGSSYPNSLSFVPAGTLDPNNEALVGYQGSTYIRIDTSTGAMSTVGALGDTYRSSGDIVSVIGGDTYLTVTGGHDCSSNDCLVQVDPSTGALVANLGSVQHPQVYGLAFWGGSVYGFDSGGDLFEVTFPAGGGLAVTPIAIPNAPHGLSFYGAGSTTSAPRN